MVNVNWDKGPLGSLDSAGIRAAWVEMAKQDGRTIRDDGDTNAALERRRRLHDAVYEVPYLAHATMEPQNTTASYRDGACEIWSPNQGPDVAQALAADALGIPRDKVTVHTTLMGGGFGRRGIPDFVAGSGAGVASGEAAGEADLVARRRHAPRLLSARDLQRDEGGAERPGSGAELVAQDRRAEHVPFRCCRCSAKCRAGVDAGTG